MLTSFADRRDRNKFLQVYKEEVTTGPGMAKWPACVGPITYKGQGAIKSDIAHFKAALKASGVEEGFMTSVAPASAARFANKYYKTDEEFIFACADALREEYKAIVDVVRKQKGIGIDVPGDGEFGKSMGHKVNYRAWWS